MYSQCKPLRDFSYIENAQITKLQYSNSIELVSWSPLWVYNSSSCGGSKCSSYHWEFWHLLIIFMKFWIRQHNFYTTNGESTKRRIVHWPCNLVNGLVSQSCLFEECSWYILWYFSAITGPSDGIGKGYARHLARLGFNIVLIARNETELRMVAKDIGKRLLGLFVY